MITVTVLLLPLLAVFTLQAMESDTQLQLQSIDKPVSLTASDSKLESNITPIVLSQPPTFPEGGLQGWLAVLGGALVQYCTFGYANAFGVYQDFYVRVYLDDYSPSVIGWIGGTQIFLVFSLGIITGRAFDRGYFHHLMITGAVLHALALFMLSLSHKNQYYQVILTQGICLGLSCGLCYIPSLTIVSHYFHKQRPLAVGIVSSGSALGAVLHPIMLNHLFHGSLGFNNGVRVSAAINTFLLIVANLIMRTRLPPKKAGNAFSMLQFAREPGYVAVVIAGVLIFCGLFFPVFYLQLYAILHNIDNNYAFYLLSILNASSVFGRIIPAIFAPKLGSFNLMIFFTLVSGITILCLSKATTVAETTLFAIFYGFISGAAIALSVPVLGLLSKDFNEIGARIGVDFFFCGFFGLFATPIAGALLTSEYHWLRAILFSGITMIAAAGFFTVSRWFVVQQKGTQLI